jgi:MFS superfamily sulfate permease-like transporter
VIGLYVGITVAAIFFIVAIIDLVVDYKTRILEARRGVF